MSTTYYPHHEKANILHMQKQRHRSASQHSAKLNSTYVFALGIVQFLLFLNAKCPGLCTARFALQLFWKLHCWFSHDMACMVVGWRSHPLP